MTLHNKANTVCELRHTPSELDMAAMGARISM